MGEEEKKNLRPHDGKNKNRMLWFGISEEAYFRKRAARADVEKAKELISRVGIDTPPLPGDEIPDSDGNTQL